MPTPFDILGSLSFAQGVLTLIAAIIAAVFSATQQARDKVLNNDTLMVDLVDDLASAYARAGPYLETYGSRSEATKMTIEKWLRQVEEISYAVKSVAELRFWQRWLQRDELAKQLAQYSKRVVRVVANMDLVLMEWRLLDAYGESYRELHLMMEQVHNHVMSV